jgi:hypothetical protein
VEEIKVELAVLKINLICTLWFKQKHRFLLILFAGVLVIVNIIICTQTASAAGSPWPVYDTYDSWQDGYVPSSSDGYDISTNADKTKFYIKTESGRLAINVGGTSDAQGINLIRYLTVPFTGGKMVVEYSMQIDTNGYIYSLQGCPKIISSDSKTGALMRFQGNSQGKTYIENNAMDANFALNNTSWQAGVNYKIKFICDYLNKSYEYYVDSGNGYEKKSLSSGRNLFSFDVTCNNMQKLQFSFANNYTANSSKIYIDNLKIYPVSTNYFVSASGNDNNVGSFDAPFLTQKKAYDEVIRLKALGQVPHEGIFVFLKSGTYNFDNTYTYGHLDASAKPNIVSYRPLWGEKIVLQGNYNLDIPEVTSFPSQEIAGLFVQDIKSTYVSKYLSVPLTIGSTSLLDQSGAALSSLNAGQKVKAIVNIGNNGLLSGNCVLLIGIYNQNSKLTSVAYNNVTIPSGNYQQATIEVVLPEGIDNSSIIKAFLWHGLSNTIPLNNTATSYSLNVVNNNQGLLSVFSRMDGNKIITLSGNITSGQGKEISVKVLDPNGIIKYVDQTTSDVNGNYTLNCSLQEVYTGNYQVIVNCN